MASEKKIPKSISLPPRSEIKRAITRLLAANGPMLASHVHEYIVNFFQVDEENLKLKRSGQLAYKNEIRWARQDLVKEGLIDQDTQHGLWKLREGPPIKNSIVPSVFRNLEKLKEGVVKSLIINVYERNAKARAVCIEHYGLSCIVCGYNFEKKFGLSALGMIHVHHLIPISSIGEEYDLDPVNDLVPICPNCHYMAHRRANPYSIQELKEMLCNSDNIERG